MTAPEGVAVTGAEFVPDGDGLLIKVTFVNLPETGDAPFAAAAVWEGDEPVGTRIFEVGTQSEQRFALPELKSGQRVELYIWDSFSGGEFLADRIYSYTAE